MSGLDWAKAKRRAATHQAKRDKIQTMRRPPVPSGLIPLRKAGPKCPLCEQPTIMRARKKDAAPFWGCKRFPLCKGIVAYVPAPPDST